MLSHTVTAVLDAPQAKVFDFLSRVENLPLWATDFARELKYEDGKAKVVNGLGECYFTIDADLFQAARRAQAAAPSTAHARTTCSNRTPTGSCTASSGTPEARSDCPPIPAPR